MNAPTYGLFKPVLAATVQLQVDRLHCASCASRAEIVLLALPGVAREMGAHLVRAIHALIHDTIGLQISRLIQFGLTTAVMAGPGRRFFRVGLFALWHGRPAMNALVAVGTLAACLVSMLALFAPGVGGLAQVYFEPAAAIILLVLVGRDLETQPSGRAAGAIQALIGLQPATARVRRRQGVSGGAIKDLYVCDLVESHPVARLPADGVVTEGTSWIDTAKITGEPVPVAARVSSALTSAATALSSLFVVGNAVLLSRLHSERRT